ncbi:MAG: S-methyl-5-thioribose-1-phosphate isomerase [Fastidiosipila sp.]|nr:S-methyl-5-thioribose-1-phosphate isomerase [Fastidiosipila sp.]
MNQIENFFERIITVKWAPNNEAVDIIDQTLLPNKVKRIQLNKKEEMWEAIKKLQVRGAPAIGVMAAFSIAFLADEIKTTDYNTFCLEYKKLSDYFATSRPTAVNLFWALNRMLELVESNKNIPVPELKQLLFEEADAIRDEDVEISRNIGEIGFELLKKLKLHGKPIGILTHCNAGTLATAKYGTATAPMYIALEHDWTGDDMHVYCDETRPLLQGSRLTAFELSNAGIKTTVQCDNMASVLMAEDKIDIIFVGCDRVAKNGDTANKIGTNTIAILAKHYGIPMYICAPSSTIDLKTDKGTDIPIEIRDPDEITAMWYKERMAPQNIDVFNPAFDVTDHSLLSGIITERGLCEAPYEKAFEELRI